MKNTEMKREKQKVKNRRAKKVKEMRKNMMMKNMVMKMVIMMTKKKKVMKTLERGDAVMKRKKRLQRKGKSEGTLI